MAISELAAKVDALERRNQAATELLRDRYGWHPFGAHIDIVDVRLEFYGEDEDGLPYFEREVIHGEQTD